MHKQASTVGKYVNLRRRAAACTLTTIALAAALLIQPHAAYADSPQPIGAEFQVAANATGHQLSSCAAMDAAGDFVVAWEDDRGGTNYQIYARQYDRNGHPLSPEFKVSADAGADHVSPSVAMDADGDFVVAWGNNSDFWVYARLYQKDGTPRGAPFRVNTNLALPQTLPGVAMDADGDFVVAWSCQGDFSLDICRRRFKSDGSPRDNQQLKVNTNAVQILPQMQPGVAMDADGDFVIVWFGLSTEGYFDVYRRLYHNDGTTPDAQQQRVDTGQTDSTMASVAMDADGDFVVVWENVPPPSAIEIYRRLYRADGTPRDPNPVRVNTTLNALQMSPSVAMDVDGDFVVAWTGEVSSYDQVFARRFQSNGVARDPNQFMVNTGHADKGHGQPRVAADAEGNFVVAWIVDPVPGTLSDAYARRYGLPRLTLAKTASQETLKPGETFTYTLVAASEIATTTNAIISDTLPSGVNFVGPASIQPPGAGTPGVPPRLATNLTIGPGGRVTITFAVTVSAAGGVRITNTATISSDQLTAPVTATHTITVSKLNAYLPEIMKAAR